jgi:hypothetical protein
MKIIMRLVVYGVTYVHVVQFSLPTIAAWSSYALFYCCVT